jgi:hypothetical protein
MKSIKFVFLKAIIVVFFTFCASFSFSQNQPVNYVKTDATNKVEFMGIENGFLVFDLLFSEVPAKGCTLKIMDSDGNIMFEETISERSFTRRYKVAKEETSRISFKALGKGFVFNQSFIIKKEETLVVTSE